MMNVVAKTSVSRVVSQAKFVGTRSFFNFVGLGKNPERTIPTDAEVTYGRRKMELDADAMGEDAFCREPIIPPINAGTKENPIQVPSVESMRTVGFEHPLTHQMLWFNLEKGPMHFVPDTGLYFKLVPFDGWNKVYGPGQTAAPAKPAASAHH